MSREKGYDNRSLAIADMVRAQLIEHQQQQGDRNIAGTITIVYDHHKPHLMELLTDIQHDHGGLIIATLHVHLDHHNCLEVLAVRGRADRIKQVADALIAAKGVNTANSPSPPPAITCPVSGRRWPCRSGCSRGALSPRPLPPHADRAAWLQRIPHYSPAGAGSAGALLNDWSAR